MHKNERYSEYKFNDASEIRTVFRNNFYGMFEPYHHVVHTRMVTDKPRMIVVDGRLDNVYFLVFAFSRLEIYNKVAQLSSQLLAEFCQEVNMLKMLKLEGIVKNGTIEIITPKKKITTIEDDGQFENYEFTCKPGILVVTDTNDLMIPFLPMQDVFNFEVKTLRIKAYTSPGKSIDECMVWYDGFTGIPEKTISNKK